MVAQPLIYFSVVGDGGELCAGSGMWEEEKTRANVDFLKEPGNADAMHQNRIKWAHCSIPPTPSEVLIDQSHPPKAKSDGG